MRDSGAHNGLGVRAAPGDWSATVPLPSDTSAAAFARLFLQERATGLPGDFLADAMLATSELVANAILHGRPAFWLFVRDLAAGIAIGVHDDGDSMPFSPVIEPRPDQMDGRGLRIVEALRSTWGVQPTPTGKMVWFEMHM
ncbi:ATP-binding protein [Jatrophihabitans telluris]|uniref:ATP-binding protein n=1 Tax=Jatrophihabitans telluris TaxID=2038343 RepID=A0ABY4QTR9_9ACTN|nr:ATP-binding protein [Jatrophihabitans telluris]UQX87065.1 ATP-binding protein [Jatrophihabitans telluris]